MSCASGLTSSPRSTRRSLWTEVQAAGLVARLQRTLPIYRVLERSGPDHAPAFMVEVRVNGLTPATAEGGSRQEAEKAAALALLRREGRA